MSHAATAMSFRSHVHPEEVTPALRARMSQNMEVDHLVWSGFIALLTMMLCVGTAIVDTVDQQEPAIYWHLGTLIALGLWAELICYFIYDSRKQFVRDSAVTTALVVAEPDEDSIELRPPRVRVRYAARPDARSEELPTQPDAREAWADLDGLSTEFEKNLHVGDLITILYDPNRPSHMRIVEFEH